MGARNLAALSRTIMGGVLAGRVDVLNREQGELVVAGQRFRVDPTILPRELRVGDTVAIKYERRKDEDWVLEVWPGRR